MYRVFYHIKGKMCNILLDGLQRRLFPYIVLCIEEVLYGSITIYVHKNLLILSYLVDKYIPFVINTKH
jgi:hypothetical protein